VALDDFIVTSYCLVDDLFEEVLDGRRLRSRAPAPLLDVREVLSVEPVGESLGIDTEKGIFLFFRRRYSEWSPKLIRVHCTTFTRQAANLWKMKWLMWKALLAKTEHDGAISLVDSFAVPVCSFAKAPRHRSFAGAASCGFDAMARAVFYGFDGHLRVAWSGVIAEATLAPPSEHDRWVAEYDPLPWTSLSSTISEASSRARWSSRELDGNARRTVYNTLGVTVWAARTKEDPTRIVFNALGGEEVCRSDATSRRSSSDANPPRLGFTLISKDGRLETTFKLSPRR
jgi:Transposase DDE domain